MTQLTQEYLDKSLKNLPTKRDFIAIVDSKIKDLPTKRDVGAIVDDRIKDLPTKQDVEAIVNNKIKDLPTKRDVEAIVINIVDSKVKNLASREDLKNLATKKDVENAVDNLARVVNRGFEEQQKFLINKLDVRERVGKLEKDMGQIKVALHLKQ